MTNKALLKQLLIIGQSIKEGLALLGGIIAYDYIMKHLGKDVFTQYVNFKIPMLVGIYLAVITTKYILINQDTTIKNFKL